MVRALCILVVALGCGAAEVPAFAFRAENLYLSVRLPTDAGTPGCSTRLVLIADQPRGTTLLRLREPRFRTVGTDTGERLALLVRPASRAVELAGDRQTTRDRAVRLSLDVSPPRVTVHRLLDLAGSVHLEVAVGEPRVVPIPLHPPPAHPLAIPDLPGSEVQVEDLKGSRMAVIVPAALARLLGEPEFVDADGAVANVRAPQRIPQPDGGVRLQFDLGGNGAVAMRLAWFPVVQDLAVPIAIPPLTIPGGMPGIGDASAPPRRQSRPRLRQPLQIAILDDDRVAFDWLLLADPRARGQVEGDGFTPFHRALLCGRGGIAARLIVLGADPAAPVRDGRTPLQLAVAGGDPDCVRLLLDRHADVHALVPSTGWNLLHLAVDADAEAVVPQLLAAGLDPWEEAKDGRGAVDLARDQSRWRVLRALLGNAPGVGGPGQAP